MALSSFLPRLDDPPGAGVEGALHGMERSGLAAAVSTGGLLDTAAPIKCTPLDRCVLWISACLPTAGAASFPV